MSDCDDDDVSAATADADGQRATSVTGELHVALTGVQSTAPAAGSPPPARHNNDASDAAASSHEKQASATDADEPTAPVRDKTNRKRSRTTEVNAFTSRSMVSGTKCDTFNVK